MVVILFAFSVSGCYIGADAGLRRKEHKQALQVFKYLKKEDVDALNGLFSESVAENHDLDEEWEAFFDEIDGNIVSYDKLEVSVLERWDDNWKTTRALIQVTFRNVTTDEGEVYEKIIYNDYAIHSDKDSVGITVFCLENDKAVVGGGE